MLYAITGGVAKYVAQLMDEGCKTWEDMLNAVCRPSSIFIEEGTELLVGEFGRKYQIYYSILQLIAKGMRKASPDVGKNQQSRSEILYRRLLPDVLVSLHRGKPYHGGTWQI